MQNQNLFEDLLGKIKSSPLFQLSLSSKELFHSNFIYWIGDIYKKEFFQFWKEKLNLENTEIVEIQREKGNIDLTIILKNGKKIIIENKVKSVPTKEQLEKYKKSEKGNYYVLLSVYKNTEIVEETDWAFVSYNNLKEGFFSRIETENLYHKELIKDYSLVIDFMTEIFKELKRNIHTLGYLDTINSDKNEILNKLKEIRFADAYLKHFAQILAEEIKNEIRKNFKNKIIDNWENTNVGDINVGSGFTNTTGIVELKYVLKKHKSKPRVLVIQLQSNQLRFVILDSGGKSMLEIAKRLQDNKKWIDKDCVGKILNLENISLFGEGSGTKDNKKGFNAYKKNGKETFVYKYVDLSKAKPNFSNEEIVNVFIEGVKYINENQQDLLELIQD